jgi:hypothetical protein
MMMWVTAGTRSMMYGVSVAIGTIDVTKDISRVGNTTC